MWINSQPWGLDAIFFFRSLHVQEVLRFPKYVAGQQSAQPFLLRFDHD